MAAADILPLIETPKDTSMGDYALPCFRFAKQLRKAPQAIAQELLENELPSCIERAEVAGGYANFFIKRDVFIQTVLDEISQKGAQYGAQDLGHGRAVCIDYSSINIAKPFHIGHLSSTAIGHALYNIYNFMGYQSVGINHLGDWGTQFGKLLAAFSRWSDEETLQAGGVDSMLELYVRFHDEAETDDALNEEAREWFKRIEDGDETATRLFHMFKDVTIREVMHIYDLLGIRFDSYAGESFYNDKMQPVVDELREKNLLVQSDGAYVVDLEAYDMPPCMILKSDGATLYSTRDLAAAFYRKQEYDFAKSLYVVAYQQNLHFRQWFKVVELMGYSWADELEHVAFGMVSLEDGGTLSTRRGNVVKLEDVLNSAIGRAREIMQEKSSDLDNMDEVAEQVGVGAVVFSVLHNARIKDISFSYDRVLAFDGETAPYLQYTHARSCNVLKKAPTGWRDTEADYAELGNEFAFEVIRLLSSYPSALVQALEKNEPYIISRHIIDIAQAYNRYYYEVRIIDESAPGATAARLQLCDSVRLVIKRALELLGIQAPERM